MLIVNWQQHLICLLFLLEINEYQVVMKLLIDTQLPQAVVSTNAHTCNIVSGLSQDRWHKYYRDNSNGNCHRENYYHYILHVLL